VVLKERNDLVEGIVWLARYNAAFVDNSVVALTDRANELCSTPFNGTKQRRTDR